MTFTTTRTVSAWLAALLAFLFALPPAAAADVDDAGEDKVSAAVREFVAKNLPVAQTFQSPGAFANDYGFSVAINERFAVIGSPGEPATTTAYGTIHIYKRVNSATGQPWQRIQTIVASDLDGLGSGADRFGESVALSGTTLVVGSPVDTDDGNQVQRVGSAYVFTYDLTRTPTPGFVFRTKLLASAAGLGVDGDGFGRSVAVAGPHVVVGAPGADPAGVFGAGAAALYACTRAAPPNINCAFRTLLVAPDPRSSGQFGRSVSATLPAGEPNATIAVGAPGQCATPTCDPSPGAVHGAAYAFTVAAAGAIPPAQRLLDSVPALFALFGQSISVDGTTLAVGAPGDASRGAVQLFERRTGGFVATTKLRPSAVQSMQFGASVSLARGRLVVGAPLRSVGTPEPASTGSAFLYEQVRDQWVQRDELFRVASTTDSRYGWAVATGGGAVLVGEPNGPTPPTSSPGRAYGYLVARSANVTRIANPNTIEADADRFGSDVAISGGFMAVGLPNRASAGTPNVGEVRLYQQTAGGGWVPTNQAALAFPEAVLANARFGQAVALTQNAAHLVVGAPGAFAGAGGNAGAVFVYARSGTAFLPAVQRFKLVRPAGVIGDDFGGAVDISPSANLLVVGAPQADGGRGGVTVFRDVNAPAPSSGVTALAKFDGGGNVPPPAGGGIGDKWGSSVATDGNQAVAGAPENGAGDDGGDGFATVIDDGGSGTFVNMATVDAPPDTGAGDEQDFGAAVDIDNGMVAVGAPGTDMADADQGGMNPDEGVAYAYDVSSNPAQPSAPVTLEQPGGGIGDKWGSSVAVDGGSGTVGSGGPGADVPTDSGVSTDQGAVSTFDCYVAPSGLVVCPHDETLFGKNASHDEGIGSALDIENGELAIGAPDAGPADEGAIYVTEDLFAVDGLFRDGFE
ncbi:MAG TPA: hypothetical protein VND91_06300 [Candidatus Saccharimonadia bacterium]|nr:hypothetical protein [Candidatus Saccharimonadia bacterium]